MSRIWFPSLALLILLAGCSSGTVATSSSSSSGYGSPVEQQIGDAVLAGVNQERARAGRDTLVRDSGLDQLAFEHSTAMAAGDVSFGHAGLAGRMSQALAAKGGKRGAENVSSQPRAAEEVAPATVQRWLGSADHKKNMLGPYRHTGIGVAQAADGRFFVTEIFVE